MHGSLSLSIITPSIHCTCNCRILSLHNHLITTLTISMSLGERESRPLTTAADDCRSRRWLRHVSSFLMAQDYWKTIRFTIIDNCCIFRHQERHVCTVFVHTKHFQFVCRNQPRRRPEFGAQQEVTVLIDRVRAKLYVTAQRQLLFRNKITRYWTFLLNQTHVCTKRVIDITAVYKGTLINDTWTIYHSTV